MQRDNAYLEDIRLACKQIANFTAGITSKEFLTDDKTRAAVERQITITVEAAGKVSAELKADHSEVPWRRLVQLRNFYIHAYEQLSPEEVWGTAKRLAPRVERLVAALIPDDDDELE